MQPSAQQCSLPSQDTSQTTPASQFSPHESESSLGTAQDDTIKLNWILFDKSSPRTPAVISIPRDLYDQPSQYCRPLFVQPLLEEYGIVTAAYCISFWIPKSSLSVRDSAEEGWAASIHDFKAHFKAILRPQTFSKNLAVLDRKLVHLVITVRDGDPGSVVVPPSKVDRAVPELKEYTRYRNALLTLAMTPSEGAKSSAYRHTQANPAQAIYDGRRAPNSPTSTRAPPIQIFHPIFSDFIHWVHDPAVQPTVDDLKNVHELMSFASKLADRHEEPIGDSNTDTRPASLIIDLHQELGESGCDPTTRASLRMKRYWLEPSLTTIREKCCCPTFLLAGGGPWLCVLGGVFTDKFIVHRLTDMQWLALSSPAEDARVYHTARILIALRKCIAKLRRFYESLHDVAPLVDNEPHPRYFPYPTSFTAKGDTTLTRFRYLASLQQHASCLTYLAEIPNKTGATGDPVKVVVKFVARYGEEVHEFLARKGCAPTLLYYGPLPDTPLSRCGILPGPAQSPAAAPGVCLRSDRMHMVVMDYIPAPPSPTTPPPSDVRAQLARILRQLHSAGYVFGDLRTPNILFDEHGKVKLIDFNWCGRYDMSMDMNENTNTNIPDQPLPNDLQYQNQNQITDDVTRTTLALEIDST